MLKRVRDRFALSKKKNKEDKLPRDSAFEKRVLAQLKSLHEKIDNMDVSLQEGSFVQNSSASDIPAKRRRGDEGVTFIPDIDTNGMSGQTSESIKTKTTVVDLDSALDSLDGTSEF